MNSALTFALFACCAAAVQAGWTAKNATGDIRGFADESDPFVTYLVPNDATGITEDAAPTSSDKYPFLKMEYVGADLVDKDGASVLDLIGSGLTDKYYTLKDDTNFYRMALGARTGGSTAGASLQTAQYIAKKSFTASSIDIPAKAGLSSARNGVCMVINSDKSCADVSVSPGHYKFSFFVETLGSEFKDKVPTAATHMRVSMELTPTNFGDDVTYYYNGDKTNKDPSKALTSITVAVTDSGEAKEFTYKFPQKFNNNGEKSDTMVITGKEGSGKLTVYYDMPMADFDDAGKWGLYDPDVSYTKASTGGGSGSGSGSDTGASSVAVGVTAAAVAAVAMFMRY